MRGTQFLRTALPDIFPLACRDRSAGRCYDPDVMSDESTPRAKTPSEMDLLRAEMRAGFESLDTRITTEVAAIRTHFDVVAEDLRESLKGVIDKTVATGKKVDRLIASNAIEHAAFQELVTDHEVRITRLERTAGQDPQSPAADHQT